MSARSFDASRVPVDYMADGMKMWVEYGLLPGSFGTALLKNDLLGAVRAADSNNRAALADWAAWMDWTLPAKCWGSPELVGAWAAAGGWNGKEKAA